MTVRWSLLSTPFAFFASIGKGYLLPIGFIFIVLIFSQLFAAIDFGYYFPWSLPALLSGIAGDVIQVRLEQLTILLLTSILGMISTQVWWWKSDYHA